MFLTAKEIAELTGRIRKTSQVQVLRFMGIAEWACVTIDKDMQVFATGRPYALLSESEQWRVDAMIAEAISNLSGLGLLVLDRADCLDLQGRTDLLEWLDVLAQDHEIETVLIFATLKSMPENLPNSIGAFWIEGGVVVNKLQEAA